MDKNNFGCFAFFYNPQTQEVLLHHRDSIAKVNPNKWGFFGGSKEGQETPEQTLTRELHEEIGMNFSVGDFQRLDEYFNEDFSKYRFAYFIEKNIDTSEIKLGEGQGYAWIPLNKVFEYDLTEKTRKDLLTFIKIKNLAVSPTN